MREEPASDFELLETAISKCGSPGALAQEMHVGGGLPGARSHARQRGRNAVGLAGYTLYAATKGGVVALTRTVGLE